jgi:hemerythrin
VPKGRSQITENIDFINGYIANIMAEFEWIEKLSIGNALLDAEHKKLIEMVNNAENAIRAKDSDNLLQALNLLADCVCNHFENEEKIALVINLSFSNHEMKHQYVKNELLNMRDKLASMNGRWSESVAYNYSYFLSEWLYEHLNEEAKMIKPVLQTYPYNFDPISEISPSGDFYLRESIESDLKGKARHNMTPRFIADRRNSSLVGTQVPWMTIRGLIISDRRNAVRRSGG